MEGPLIFVVSSVYCGPKIKPISLQIQTIDLTWYSKVFDCPCAANFCCMVSAIRSVISSSFKKWTSRFVGCTFTSTQRGSISRLSSWVRFNNNWHQHTSSTQTVMSLWEAPHGILPPMNVSCAEIPQDGLFKEKMSDARLQKQKSSTNGW